MKKLHFITGLVVLGALISPASAAEVEPVRVNATYVPRLSPAMLMEGVTSGKVTVAIDVSAEGQLTDLFVLGYTHHALVNPLKEAMREWKYTPARLNGQPISVQATLTVDYSAEDVMISRSAAADVESLTRDMLGDHFVERVRGPKDIDATPTRVSTVMPHYPKDAEKQGVRGRVRVHFYIDGDGAVRMPAVDPGVDPFLADLAVSALREWRFSPPTSRGKPVTIAARQEFAFGQ